MSLAPVVRSLPGRPLLVERGTVAHGLAAVAAAALSAGAASPLDARVEDAAGPRVVTLRGETFASLLTTAGNGDAGHAADVTLGTARWRIEPHPDGVSIDAPDAPGQALPRLRALLEAALAAPDAPVATLPRLPADEAAALLALAAGPREPRAPATVHRLFSAQAARTPDAVAIEGEGARVTYRELDARSDRLAHVLRRHGAARGAFVGLLLERSADAVAAMLATMKAGAAYLPLDPAYPAQRLAFMVREVRPVLLLATEATLAAAPADARTLLLEDLWREAKAAPTGPLSDEATPRDLAYVIYTSGSTGRPKGVLIEHDGVANYCAAQARAFGLGPGGRFAQISSLSFDGSVLEIHATLLHGGTVCLLDVARGLSGPALQEQLAAARATHLFMTPSVLRTMRPEALPDARVLAIGGEPTPPQLVNAWAPGRAYFNVYGPTETTVIAMAKRLEPPLHAPPPLGRAIANVRAYVLDDALQPAPQGEVGELWIAGPGVARGYLDRPELTADAFRPDPFAANGERMYRSGDLARVLPDGDVEFVGRKDHQVKVNGVRIELGEIENVLREHPRVQDVVVTARADAQGQKRLVAYVVPREAGDDAAGEADAVDRWHDLFEDTYARSAAPDEPELDLAGWNSSYDGRPIPPEEMREWRDGTLGRIRALRPRRVLEIGCGTGLLLLPLAPTTERYVGLDFSRTTLARLGAEVERRGLRHVELLERTADALDDLERAAYDLVIVNSVAQYFPDGAYLARVLRGAVDRVAPGGAILFGDLRSLPLLDAFHLATQLAQAGDDLPAPALAARVARRVRLEEELAIHPRFWGHAAALDPRVTSVAVQPRRGRAWNELTEFRYDVVLGVGEPAAPTPAPAWSPYAPGALDARLAAGDAVIALAGVPNRRLARVNAAASALATSAAASDVRAAAARADAGEDPEDVAARAEAAGYDTLVSWADGRSDGSFDLLLRRRSTQEAAPLRLAPHADAPPPPWTNDPLRRRTERTLVPLLRAHGKAALAPAMVPHAFVVLDRFPLNANGKVDRAALPPPEDVAGARETYAAPETEAEEALCALVAEVLGLPLVGTRDDFFEIGGDSILAIQLVARARSKGLLLTARQVFEQGTVGRIAAAAVPLDRPAPLPLATGEPFPLTPMQRGMLYHSLDDPARGTYFEQMLVELRGPLDERRFAEAWSQAARRHGILRASFAWQGLDAPVLTVHDEAPDRMDVVDLARAPDAPQALRGLLAEDRRRGFDLQSPPLSRATLVRTGADERALLWSFHHAILDGWSVPLVLRDALDAYGRLAAGGDGALPPAPQFESYARWLAARDPEPARAHWTARLSDFDTPTPVPLAADAPTVDEAEGDEIRFALPPGQAKVVLDRLQAERLTLGTLVQGAWAVLLARHGAVDDVCFGVASSGRPPDVACIEEVVGFLVATTPLRVRVPREAKVRAWLHDLQRDQAADRQHAHLPLPDVQACSGVPRGAPLFDTLLTVDKYPMDAASAAAKAQGLRLRVRDIVERTNYAYALVASHAESIVVRVMHDPRRVRREDAQRVAARLQRLLVALAERLDGTLADVPMLSDEERDEALRLGEAPAAPATLRDSVHALFAAQAAATPDAPAVLGTAPRTYRELDARTSRLAALLRARGVRPGDLVALLHAGRASIVESALATLKAGAGYLPLDPSQPPARLAFMMRDAGATALVADADLAPLVPAPPVALLAGPELERALADAQPAEPVARGPDDLAYVMYTSGSTGQPKGVAIPHRGIVRLVCGLPDLRLGPGEVLLHSAPPAFDAATFEIWGALLTGAAIVPMAPPRPSLVELVRAVREHGVTTLWITTPLFHLLVEDHLHEVPGLRQVLTGGEVVSPSHAARAVAALPRCRIFNAYGPTENTTFTTAHLVTSADVGAATVPIGRPIAHTRVWIEGPHGEPAPIGAPGELVTSGDGVGLGYVGHAAGDARFLTDAAGRAVAYRTGDVARWNARGQLEFIGRRDGQVKIRGHRIETSEVEVALLATGALREAAVVPHGLGANRALVAYVVPKDGASADAAALRLALERRLPEHMVPQAFVPLPDLPRKSSGKLDRRALPAPERPVVRAFVAPRGHVEEALAGVWREVLRVESVGATDDFLELGGHSLLATQVASRIQSTFGVAVPLRTLFEARRLDALAARVTSLVLESIEGMDEAEAVRLAGRDAR